MNTRSNTPAIDPDSEGDEADEHRTVTIDGNAIAGQSQRLAIEEPLGTVDRFRLERKLGAGGMGTVYEAWDEKLMRRVALKFLRGPTDHKEKRFFREAQGLARISHPNVVPVYDVGRFEGRVWIAMEFVPGGTLGAWAAEAPREPAEIVRHWIAAGHGLAAIHAAGLIHRDIKPHNVLLGDDGRVRIIDFGLVKAADTLDDSESQAPAITDRGASRGASRSGSQSAGQTSGQLGESLTGVDSFLGTPAYAAPEHWDRRFADARSDQYSLCISLWEALCGSRPPRQERARGGLVPLAEGVRLPKRLYHALSRGLALEPRDRFEDMHGLLAALEPPRRRWLAPTLAAGVTAIVATAAALALTPAPEPAAIPAPCAEAAAPVDALWTDQRRQLLAQQLDPALAEQTRTSIDDWAKRWSDAATNSCEDVHVRQLHSEQALDRRGFCLSRSLDGLEAFLLAVESGKVTTMQGATEWLGALTDPQACLDEAVLHTSYEKPAPEHAQEIAALRRQLISISVEAERSHASRIRALEGISARADELADQPLSGEAALALGMLHVKAYDLDAARTELGRALDIGTATHDVELAAEAWSELFSIEILATPDRGRAHWAWSRQAALFAGVEPSPRRRARIQHDYARYLILDTRLAEAELAIREALANYEHAGATAAWDRAAAFHMLGYVLGLLGRGDEAVEAHANARQLELGSARTKARDVSPANAVLVEAVTLITAGQPSQARTKLVEGLEQAIAEQGPRGELVARFHIAITAACNQLGDLDCVRHHSEQADTISLIAVGPTDLLRIDVLSTIGVVAWHDDRLASAATAFEQALSIALQHTDPDSVEVALAEGNLADTLHALGQDQRARTLARHAIEVLERELAVDHPSLLPIIITLAEIEIGRGELGVARPLLQRAEVMAADSDPATRKTIDDLLSRAH